MAQSKMQAEIIGVVTSPVETKVSKNGNTYLRMSVEVQDGKYAKNVQVVCFGEVASRVHHHVRTGDTVQVFGRPEAEAFTGRDGQPKAAIQCIAEVVTLVEDAVAAPPPAPAQQGKASRGAA